MFMYMITFIFSVLSVSLGNRCPGSNLKLVHRRKMTDVKYEYNLATLSDRHAKFIGTS